MQLKLSFRSEYFQKQMFNSLLWKLNSTIDFLNKRIAGAKEKIVKLDEHDKEAARLARIITQGEADLADATLSFNELVAEYQHQFQEQPELLVSKQPVEERVKQLQDSLRAATA